MATPPGGYPYGNDQQENPPLNRFNFPSAPTPRDRSEAQHPSQVPYTPQPPVPPHAVPGGGYSPPSAPGHVPTGHVPPPAGQGRHAGQGPQHRRSGSPSGGKSNPLVRPYAMTGGRTRPRYQLAIEALVHTTAQPAQLQGQLPEHQRICHLCREIKSVAEISALLSIPLGVARILVADLAEAGLVAIHQPGGDASAGGQPDVTLLERVLSGLRNL
ncbi:MULTISPECIES: DUF742 domain-containing protein [Streptomyces]|uniref:DUF742 domain-containing protein n=1 Tax=Streptomyces TaxID=1883 RepID=UPI00163CC788|nr:MULTISPECIES: DUF742 domain-containing protein [Streptomyces]MBC2874628.1 DUF742 domain-containing protein [Streptomyces sp. TYQ1024]UBI36607.1 DUF742 domain-containing protein [Streptomyces mobaraensis]UKW29199.1 DUF742 domain-containing protein [Streptomyces sp. TYQ1024]